MLFSDEDEKCFLEIKPSSLAASLMLPDKVKRLSCPDENGAYSSIAYGAYINGTLSRLDEIFSKFDIKNAKNKHRVREDWLNYLHESPACIRKRIGNVYSALTELVVADHVDEESEVTHLDLRDGCNPDLAYKNGTISTSVEIKYLGILPELQESITNKIKLKDGSPSAMWFDDQQIPTYIYSRIAEAALQLSTTHDSDKEIWLVFSPSGERGNFEKNFFGKSWNWPSSAQSWLENLCSDKKWPVKVRKILSKKPQAWLSEADSIIFATLNNEWRLEEVEKHKEKK